MLPTRIQIPSSLSPQPFLERVRCRVARQAGRSRQNSVCLTQGNILLSDCLCPQLAAPIASSYCFSIMISTPYLLFIHFFAPTHLFALPFPFNIPLVISSPPKYNKITIFSSCSLHLQVKSLLSPVTA